MATKPTKKPSSAKSAAVAVRAASGEVVAAANEAFSLPGFKVKNVLTIPLMLITEGAQVAVKLLEPIRERAKNTLALTAAEAKAAGVKPDDDEKPMHVVRAINIATGEVVDLILQTVVESSIRQAYPNDDEYVGKSFAIRNRGKKQGKRRAYYQMDVVEIEQE